MIGDFVEMLRTSLTGEQHLVVPEGNAAGAVDPRANIDDRSRSEGIVEKFLFSGAHHLHGSADGPGKARGLDRLHVAGFASEPAADERGDDPHSVGREIDRSCDLVACAERILRRGPDRAFAAFDVGERCVGFDRGVRNVAVEVASLDHAISQLACVVDVSSPGSDFAFGGDAQEMLVDVLLGQRRWRQVEFRVDPTERVLGHVWQLVEHRNEVSVLYQPHAVHLAGTRCVGLLQRRAVRGRSKNLRVEHARQANVGSVLGLAGHLLE
jgi:hypothetical protein